MLNTPTSATKPRIGLTIIYNGLHHLLHKGFVQFMVDNFDLWVVVEGHAKPGGSTGWCKNIPVPPSSTDGTIQFMEEVALQHPNVIFYSLGKYWPSKDNQVNMGIALIRRRHSHGYLWQVDCDEHWTVENLNKAEQYLTRHRYNQGAFQFNHFVGKDLVAVGDWGSGYMTRLFLWRGQKFATHEPPQLSGRATTLKIPGIKYDHYSMYFPQDVSFKEQYYPGHENLKKNWERLPYSESFPQPITALFAPGTLIGSGNTSIIQLRRTQEGVLL